MSDSLLFYDYHYKPATIADQHSRVDFWNRRRGEQMSKLKPCPFCGNYPIVIQDASEWKVECIGEGCECLPSTWFHDTETEAIEAWNRRVSE